MVCRYFGSTSRVVKLKYRPSDCFIQEGAGPPLWFSPANLGSLRTKAFVIIYLNGAAAARRHIRSGIGRPSKHFRLDDHLQNSQPQIDETELLTKIRLSDVFFFGSDRTTLRWSQRGHKRR